MEFRKRKNKVGTGDSSSDESQVFTPKTRIPRTPEKKAKKQRMLDKAIQEAKNVMEETVKDILNKSGEKIDQIEEELNRSMNTGGERESGLGDKEMQDGAGYRRSVE
ncbi:uncharacterized protein isoform X1 [Leptinotarsa decemlineata]|uniref:uncharacterized protein isoform X1 n=1 Tax=Leptinotarsa decemlineata TaxID=7539 RepID=UPI003D30BC16